MYIQTAVEILVEMSEWLDYEDRQTVAFTRDLVQGGYKWGVKNLQIGFYQTEDGKKFYTVELEKAAELIYEREGYEAIRKALLIDTPYDEGENEILEGFNTYECAENYIDLHFSHIDLEQQLKDHFKDYFEDEQEDE